MVLSAAETYPVWVNGSADKTVSATDRGLAFGDGCFETMALRHGKIRLLDLHLNRLQRSLRRLKIPCSQTLISEQLHTYTQQLLSLGFADCTIKLVITRGVSNSGYRCVDAEPTVILSTRAAIDSTDKLAKGLVLRSCALRLSQQTALAGIKHLNRLENILARAEWSDPAIDEGLLFDLDDNLIEATAANVFVMLDNKLITPKLDKCGVEGVLRQLLLDQILPEFGIECSQTELSRQQLANAQALFLCSSQLGICPVKQLDDKLFSDFSLSISLQQALVDYYV